jgi:hypothetical protein
MTNRAVQAGKVSAGNTVVANSNDQPADHTVTGRDAVNFAPLQFAKKSVKP